MSSLTRLLARLIGIGTMLAASPALAQARPSQLSLPSATSSLGEQDDERLVVTPDQQQQPQQTDQSTPLDVNQAGRNARSSAGEVGQRQTRDSAATQAGIEPTIRIASRIQNRVQNRLRTRIDRTYDPQANANDPFLVAQDQVRTINQPR